MQGRLLFREVIIVIVIAIELQDTSGHLSNELFGLDRHNLCSVYAGYKIPVDTRMSEGRCPVDSIVKQNFLIHPFPLHPFPYCSTLA